MTKNQIKKLKPTIVKILKKNKVAKAGIFGSYARGEAKKRSDRKFRKKCRLANI